MPEIGIASLLASQQDLVPDKTVGGNDGGNLANVVIKLFGIYAQCASSSNFCESSAIGWTVRCCTHVD